MRSISAFLLLLFIAISTHASITELNGGGSKSQNRIRLIVVGDGYTASEESKFLSDAQDLVNGLKSEKYFNQFSGAINFYAAFKASAESGADHPLQGVFKNTAFNATFGSTSSLERLVTVSQYLVINFLTAEMSNYDVNYDITIVLVNDAQRGGSGGQVATTTINSDGIPVAIHEIGHSFAKLADEYDYQNEYSPRESPNTTAETNRSLIKWTAWIEGSTPLPTPETSSNNTVVGLFEGACYRPTGWYRPYNNCMMKATHNSFCPVCNDQFVYKSYNQISPVDSYSPTSSTVDGTVTGELSVSLLPLATAPSIKWIVNGSTTSETETTFYLATAGLNPGSNSVKAIAKDNSGMVKIPGHFGAISDTVTWSVTWAGSGDQYALTVTNGSGSGDYWEGFKIPVSAGDSMGYAFETWTGDTAHLDDPKAKNTVVNMPGKDIAITAMYKESNMNLIDQTHFDISSITSEWNSDYGSTKILDSDTTSFWNSATNSVQSIVFNLKNGRYTITGFDYMPRHDNNAGSVAGYILQVSTDGTNWSDVITDSLPNTISRTMVEVPETEFVNYVKFTMNTAYTNSGFFSVAEFNLYFAQFDSSTPIINNVQHIAKPSLFLEKKMLKINGFKGTKASIVIYGMNGRRYLQKPIQLVNGNAVIDISSVMKGVGIVEVSGGSTKLVKKICVTR